MNTMSHTAYFAVKTFMLRHRYVIAVICCMTLHAILCLYQIGKMDYWVDEFASLDSVRHSFGYILTQSFYEHNQPPLYFALLWIWHRLFGDGEVTLRLLSTLFSVVAIPIVATIGKVAFNRTAGVIAAFITACSHFLIVYAQDVRGYSMLVCMSALSMLCFIYFMQAYIESKQVSGFIFWVYVLVAIANLYIHPFAIFVQGAQFIIALIVIMTYKLPVKYIVKTGTIMFIATIPVIIGYVIEANATPLLLNNEWWIRTPRDTRLVYQLLFSYGPRVIKRRIYELMSTGLLGYLSIQLLLTVCKTNISTVCKKYWVVLLCVTTLAMVVAFPYIASLIVPPFIYRRYTISATIALYLLLARGVVLIKWKVAQLCITILLGGTILWTADMIVFGHQRKPQFRSAVEHIVDNIQEDDLIILGSQERVIGPYSTLNAADFYLKKYGSKHYADFNHTLATTEHSAVAIADKLLDNNGWFIRFNQHLRKINNLPFLNEIFDGITCTTERYQYNHRVFLAYLSDCRVKN